MRTIGLTGGIGSGKTTISRMFADLGVPVYDSDSAAKEIMETSSELRNEILLLLGPRAYKGPKPDRGYIASRIFGDKELLTAMNALVHPAVRTHFDQWRKRQKYPLVVQETALIFENGLASRYDRTILVTAPKAIRIERVAARDGMTATDVAARMRNQWDDIRKIPLAQYVVLNIDMDESRNKVAYILEEELGEQ